MAIEMPKRARRMLAWSDGVGWELQLYNDEIAALIEFYDAMLPALKKVERGFVPNTSLQSAIDVLRGVDKARRETQ